MKKTKKQKLEEIAKTRDYQNFKLIENIIIIGTITFFAIMIFILFISK